jgi:hypothetical protein
MPRANYYQAGDNYGRAGNYAYQAGGLFSFLGKAVKTVARIGSAVLPGPAGAIAGLIGGGGRAPQVGAMGLIPTFGPNIPVPGVKGAIQRFLPGGASGYYSRRRMNPMNVRALRRASRRLDSFAKTARKALRHSPFMLVSRASRGRRGSPGVITRSEAARALKR